MSLLARAAPAAFPGYRYLVVWLLSVAYTLNFVDRQLVSVLAEPIRQDLGLTDTQLGLLGGIVFAAFYTLFGVPVGWLADRSRRIWIISGACALWSLFTALCGTATSFLQMALFRMGVGIGEAGGSPPSHSLISDYFRPEERGTALALFSLGIPIGLMFGIGFGGWIAAEYGWRMAFFAMGLPGVAVAAALLLVVREPPRGGLDPVAAGGKDDEPAPRFFTVIADFFADRTLVLTGIGLGLSGIVGYGASAWNAPFLMRVKAMSLAEVAAYYSLLVGVTGMIGIFGAGWLADRLSRRDQRWFAWLPAAGFLVTLPAWAGLLWAPTWQIALVFMAGPALLNSCTLAPALAVVQNRTPAKRRAVSSAILLLFLNLLGLGIGPVYVGWVSDLARPLYGDRSLSVGMAALIPIAVLTIGAQLLAARSIGREGRSPRP